MAWMRRVAQRVDDPEIEILQRREAALRYVIHIRRVGNIVETIAQRRNVAVLNLERGQSEFTAPARDCPLIALLYPMVIEDRRIVTAGRRHEAISEPDQDILRRGLIE